MSCQLHVPATLPPRRNPWCPLYKKLVWRLWKRKKSVAPTRNRTPIRCLFQPWPSRYTDILHVIKLNVLQSTSSVGIHKRKKTHGISRRGLEYIVRKDRKEIECELVDWIHLTEDKGQWWGLELTVMRVSVSQSPKNTVSRWTNVISQRCLRSTQLHAINWVTLIDFWNNFRPSENYFRWTVVFIVLQAKLWW